MLKPLLAASVLLAGHVVAIPAFAQEADTVVATVNGEVRKLFARARSTLAK